MLQYRTATELQQKRRATPGGSAWHGTNNVVWSLPAAAESPVICTGTEANAAPGDEMCGEDDTSHANTLPPAEAAAGPACTQTTSFQL